MTEPSRPTGDLIADVVNQLSGLISIEVRLFRAELSETSTKLLSGAGCLAGGFSILLAGLVILLAAAVGLLVRLGTAPDLACLIVAIASIAIGAILVAYGLRAFKGANLVPARTSAQVASLGRLVKGR